MIPAETFKNSTFIQHLDKQKMPTLCILEIEGISFNLIENHYKNMQLVENHYKNAQPTS